jgi:nucleoside-diphosphate-sugar epimerase
MARAVQAVAARHGITARVKRFPWWLVRLMAPFHTTMRELLEMRYLWREPLRLDNARLVAVLGAEPRTPLLDAVEQTLLGQGCLPAQALAVA